MTLEVKVTVPADEVDKAKYLSDALWALGYQRIERAVLKLPALDLGSGQVRSDVQTTVTNETAQAEAQTLGEAIAADPKLGSWSEKTETPKADVRPRGKPASGKGRRTNVEIAEDDELERLAKEAGIKLEAIDKHLSEGMGRTEVVDDLNRFIAIKDGAVTSDKVAPAETISPQDAADEALERPKTGKLTHDDLRDASGRYIEAFDINRARLDIPKLLGCPLVDVPEDKIGEAVAAIDAAIATKGVGFMGDTAGPLPKEMTQADLFGIAQKWVDAAKPEDPGAAGAALIGQALGDMPEGIVDKDGNPIPRWRLSIVPTDQESLQAVASAFLEATP